MEPIDLSDLAEGEMRCLADLGADGVVVCRVGGEILAFGDRCSHARVSLSDGRIRRGRVICPAHGASFDVRDGRPDGPPATVPIPVYPVDAGDESAVTIRID